MSMEDSRMKKKRNELLADLADVAERVFLEHDVSAAVATIAANAIINRLADYWAGQVISYPKDSPWRLAKLELEIFDSFFGTNTDELARKYDMTESGIRRLITRVRSKLTPPNQTGLFDPPHEV